VLLIHPDGRVLLSAGSATSCTAIIILIVSLGDDALVVLWNLETGEILQEISCPHTGFVTAACWITTMRSEAKAFAFGCADGSIHIYTLDRGDVSSFYTSICYLDLQYVLHSHTVLFHLTGLMMVLSKTLHLNTHTGDSQQ
jgi:WD40 repeat protein